LPRKRIPVDLKSAARSYTAISVKTIQGVLTNADAKDADRLHAAGMMLDRGWGKAAQPVTGQDGEGDIRITIRNIIESKK
jgi:hypothetical protein